MPHSTPIITPEDSCQTRTNNNSPKFLGFKLGPKPRCSVEKLGDEQDPRLLTAHLDGRTGTQAWLWRSESAHEALGQLLVWDNPELCHLLTLGQISWEGRRC